MPTQMQIFLFYDSHAKAIFIPSKKITGTQLEMFHQ